MAIRIPGPMAAVLAVGLTLVSASSSAAIHTYRASVTASQWNAVSSGRECRLNHSIPAFGVATFTRSAGGELGFSIRADRVAHAAQAALRAVPPSWKQGAEIRELGQVAATVGNTPFRLGDELSRRLLVELEQGMVPTLYYREHAHGGQHVAIAISAVNFQPAHKEFQACVRALLPYGYADIKTTTVYFETDSSWLSYASRDALDRIVAYLRVEPDFRKVTISGYTDTVGGRPYNDALSTHRAEVVKSYLVRAGLPPAKIETHGYGQGKPVAENVTAEGRALNRRATIRVKR